MLKPLARALGPTFLPLVCAAVSLGSDAFSVRRGLAGFVALTTPTCAKT